MTREDHISYLETIGCDGWTVTTEAYMSLQFAIEALKQEPCEDAVSRQAVLDCLTATGLKKYDFILNARDKIKNLPSVKPQEPFNIDTYCKEHFMVMVDKDVWNKAEKALKQESKTGHWEWVQYDYNPKLGNWHCSECRCVIVECVDKEEKGGIPLYKYCPQCGAKMQEAKIEG